MELASVRQHRIDQEHKFGKKGQCSPSIAGRKEDKRAKVKDIFILSKGRLSVATAGSSNVIYNWLSRGGLESLERLFQTTSPSLDVITSLPKTTDAVLCYCQRLIPAKGHSG